MQSTLNPMAHARTWIRCAAVLFCCIGLPLVAFAQASGRPDLTGIVTDDAGQPLAEATVFIYTAGPKEGPGILCPSCYADCRKRVTTDSEGKFTIESLDPTLLFRVLVVAKEHQPQFVAKVDPAEKSLTVALKPAAGGDTPDQRLRGRVVDEKSEPVAGAVVSIRGVTRGNSTRFGGNDDLDILAVTDDAGEFIIRGRTPFDAVGVQVEARALAKGIFQKLKSGDTVHELKLTEGVVVDGRVLKDGQPVAGIEIGIAGAERRSEIYVGDFSVATDAEGRFSFVNLPPRTDYFLYGIMRSLGERGAIPARRVRAQDDGSTLEVGDLSLQQGFTLAGQVRLTDGKTIPEKTRVLVGREEAWDTQQVELDDQGRFRVHGVPSEIVTVSAWVKGYTYSLRNASLDTLNPFRLVGRVTADKTDLVIELEPGESRQSLGGDSRALQQEPLRGAEATKEPFGDLKVTGTVVDAGSGQLLASFTVTEGRRDSFRENFNWFATRKTPHTNGAFTTYFTKQPQPPGVLIEAEGYFPQASEPITTTETNLTFALKKGDGYAGVLVKPDGQPAAGVAVYLADLRDGVYVSGEKLEVNQRLYRGTRSTRTDEAGKFTFAPQVDAYCVIVVDESGFAQVKVTYLMAAPEVRIQPWARVEGQLLIGAKPGASESVRLWPAQLPYEHHPRQFPPLQLYLNTTTDADGRFVFERVPPIHVEVYHEPKVRDSGMGTIPMSQTTKLTLAPGQTHQLTLGGKGRPVVGRFVVKGYEGTIDWRADVQMMELVVPEPPELPNLRTLSQEFSEGLQAAETDEEKATLQKAFEQRREAAARETRAFYATEAGRQYHFNKRRYALNFSSDGSFRVEDVPGGKYSMRIDLREPGGDGPSRFNAPRIANLQREFDVPESPDDRTDEPFDLGPIELQARITLKAGQPAPDFEVATLDDKKIKLSDFKGKYVLLDFWAVWCGPCVAETPHLKETYDAFKGDDRFAMLALSLDSNASGPRNYAKKNQLGWIQGFLGEWSKTDIPSRFGVEGIPSIFLIGPDGNVVAAGLRGKKIKSTVQAALQP